MDETEKGLLKQLLFKLEEKRNTSQSGKETNSDMTEMYDRMLKELVEIKNEQKKMNKSLFSIQNEIKKGREKKSIGRIGKGKRIR